MLLCYFKTVLIKSHFRCYEAIYSLSIKRPKYTSDYQIQYNGLFRPFHKSSTPQCSCCELVVYSEQLIANLRSIRPDLSQYLKVRDDLYGTKEDETFPENFSCSPNCLMSQKIPNLIDFLIFARKIALEKCYKCCQNHALFRQSKWPFSFSEIS